MISKIWLKKESIFKLRNIDKAILLFLAFVVLFMFVFRIFWLSALTFLCFAVSLIADGFIMDDKCNLAFGLICLLLSGMIIGFSVREDSYYSNFKVDEGVFDFCNLLPENTGNWTEYKRWMQYYEPEEFAYCEERGWKHLTDEEKELVERNYFVSIKPSKDPLSIKLCRGYQCWRMI